MNYDIYLVFVPFFKTEDGKERPAVVFDINGETYATELLPVYSQKENHIKNASYYDSFMYEILDWQEAGLKKPSYINVSNILEVDFKTMFKAPRIGELSDRDVEGLLEKYNSYSD
ncbi:MAG: type II toxin-antitoxin system PemK/MazF family toxin [Streptococcaceae bacterium]|nr:type II toxin-antitoxin system PemK/MazF family toxin [Streptococcaceae bacterium]